MDTQSRNLKLHSEISLLHDRKIFYAHSIRSINSRNDVRTAVPAEGASLDEPYSTYYTRVRVINNGGTTSGGSSVLRSLFPTPFYVDYDAVSSFQPPATPRVPHSIARTAFPSFQPFSPRHLLSLHPVPSFPVPSETLTHNRLGQRNPRSLVVVLKRCGPVEGKNSSAARIGDWSMSLCHVYRTARWMFRFSLFYSTISRTSEHRVKRYFLVAYLAKNVEE